MTQPISAPPVMDEALREQLREDAEVDRQAREEQYPYERPVASVPAPLVVVEMRVSNRFNYQHFYVMPAYVGLNNVPQLVQSMQTEGCKLTDIQITFEAKEIR